MSKKYLKISYILVNSIYSIIYSINQLNIITYYFLTKNGQHL